MCIQIETLCSDEKESLRERHLCVENDVIRSCMAVISYLDVRYSVFYIDCVAVCARHPNDLCVHKWRV